MVVCTRFYILPHRLRFRKIEDIFFILLIYVVYIVSVSTRYFVLLAGTIVPAVERVVQ